MLKLGFCVINSSRWLPQQHDRHAVLRCCLQDALRIAGTEEIFHQPPMGGNSPRLIAPPAVGLEYPFMKNPGRWIVRGFLCPAGWRNGRRGLPLASGLEFHPAEPSVGADVEVFVIGTTETAVAGGGKGFDPAEQLTFGIHDMHAAGSGGPDVALGIDLHAIGGTAVFAGLGHCRGVGEDPAFAHRAVRIQRIGHPERGFGIGLGDVERLFVRGERNPIGESHVLGEQSDFALGGEAVDAIPRHANYLARKLPGTQITWYTQITW